MCISLAKFIVPGIKYKGSKKPIKAPDTDLEIKVFLIIPEISKTASRNTNKETINKIQIEGSFLFSIPLRKG